MKCVALFLLLAGATAFDQAVGQDRPSADTVQPSSASTTGFASDRNPGDNPTTPGFTSPADASAADTQFNVMMYGAKGDCSTDNQGAIEAAQRAAFAAGKAMLYFPVPPGGCYLTSSITWYGVSFIGQPSGPQGQPVEIRGKPGEDILHVSDPTTTKIPNWSSSWKIQDINFVVDNSTAGSFPKRYPGRWFDDATIAASSNKLYTVRSYINCSDIGQAIQINGAGPGGSNLVTTIASVAPCWSLGGATTTSWATITLATTASTSVTNAQAYLSLMGLPVTTTVQNCAIAMDNVDGNPADWVNRPFTDQNIGVALNNVAFHTTRGAVNNSCAIFTQGVWGMYNLDVRNFQILGSEFGIVMVDSVQNSYYQSGANDFEKWDHGSIEGVTYPWIQINGGNERIEDLELTTANGVQFLALGNKWGDTFNNSVINIPETEGSGGSYGARYQGSTITFLNTSFTEQPDDIVYLETADSTCLSCTASSGTTVYVDGYDNQLSFGNDQGRNHIYNRGQNNHITSGAITGGPQGIPYNYTHVYSPTKGFTDQAGRVSADFIRDGNFSTPYNSNDLFIWPNDIIFGNGGRPGLWQTTVQADSTSPTGFFWNNQPFNSIAQFAQFPNNSYNMTVGKNVPATAVEIFFLAKCPVSVTTGQLTVNASSAGPLAYTTFNCNTSYQVYSLPASFSAASGQNISFSNGLSTSNYVAWIGIQPTVNLLLGSSTATTQGATDRSTKVATTAQVQAAIAAATSGSMTTICSGTLSLRTAPISSGTAANTLTATCSGLRTTDNIALDFNASPLGVAGYEPSANGTLTIVKWPTENTINVAVVNNTGHSVTPGAITLSYHVYR